jgi:hypothetical protein
VNGLELGIVDGEPYFGKCPKVSCSLGVELEKDKRDFWGANL